MVSASSCVVIPVIFQFSKIISVLVSIKFFRNNFSFSFSIYIISVTVLSSTVFEHSHLHTSTIAVLTCIMQLSTLTQIASLLASTQSKVQISS